MSCMYKISENCSSSGNYHTKRRCMECYSYRMKEYYKSNRERLLDKYHHNYLERKERGGYKYEKKMTAVREKRASIIESLEHFNEDKPVEVLREIYNTIDPKILNSEFLRKYLRSKGWKIDNRKYDLIKLRDLFDFHLRSIIDKVANEDRELGI